MNKKEEFKNFVSKHPNLVSIVKDKSHTWQDLFEVYDLYGEDESLWNKYMDRTNTDQNKTVDTSSITELSKLFKNINIESVQKYIDTAQKAIGVIQQLTGAGAAAGVASAASGPEVARPINKIFED